MYSSGEKKDLGNPVEKVEKAEKWAARGHWINKGQEPRTLVSWPPPGAHPINDSDPSSVYNVSDCVHLPCRTTSWDRVSYTHFIDMETDLTKIPSYWGEKLGRCWFGALPAVHQLPPITLRTSQPQATLGALAPTPARAGAWFLRAARSVPGVGPSKQEYLFSKQQRSHSHLPSVK